MEVLLVACDSYLTESQVIMLAKLTRDYKLTVTQMNVIFIAYYVGFTDDLVKLLLQLTDEHKLNDDQMYALCLSYCLPSDQLKIVKDKATEDNLNGYEVLELLKSAVFEDIDNIRMMNGV